MSNPLFRLAAATLVAGAALLGTAVAQDRTHDQVELPIPLPAAVSEMKEAAN